MAKRRRSDQLRRRASPPQEKVRGALYAREITPRPARNSRADDAAR